LLAALAVTGCALLDVPPAREPLDERWRQRMIAGIYGAWDRGQEYSMAEYRPFVQLTDRIASHPAGAPFTPYGIVVREHARQAGAGWWMDGGLIGRVALPLQSIELFGRETSRIHRGLLSWGSVEGRDIEYDFFLLLRSRDAGGARIIATWHVPPERLALSGDPIDRDLLERSTRQASDIEGFIHPAPGEMRRHLVDGFLDFDPVSGVATVTISGLKQPFSAAVDLSTEIEK
jgi:hypothetical protein